MRKIITLLLFLLAAVLVYAYQDIIIDNTIYIINNIRQPSYTTTKNLYSKNKNYQYISITNELTPHNYQDILNIIYTSLDKRFSTVTFYCPLEYKECYNDISKATSKDNDEELTIIGNLVSPYNNFTNISIYYDTSGKVNLSFSYLYDDDMVVETEKYLDEVLKNTVTKEMTITEKLKAIHDYVVQYSEYDTNYEGELALYGKGLHQSNTSYGLFKNKLAICTGYADTLALLFDKLGVENFKVASETHIWNVVKIDGSYYHIDATWDDPTNNILGTISDKFFMISTEELHELDTTSHTFDKNVYLELK
ncbi:MAG: hypothetical protein IJS56_01800 [Bacilli bacterium]|nr:hypothetical protein [Bacilli bacterium]